MAEGGSLMRRTWIKIRGPLYFGRAKISQASACADRQQSPELSSLTVASGTPHRCNIAHAQNYTPQQSKRFSTDPTANMSDNGDDYDGGADMYVHPLLSRGASRHKRSQ